MTQAVHTKNVQLPIPLPFSQLPECISRTALLNAIISATNATNYLEIGCAGNKNFDQIQAPHKVGIDPCHGGTLRLTSDHFFEVNQELFDVVFIDGLHHQEQVLVDVKNALIALKEGGTIVLHDCLPTAEFHQFRKPTPERSAWTGDVWKAFVLLRQRSDIDLAVLDTDWGLGVIKQRPNSARLDNIREEQLDWESYQMNRDQWMQVLPRNVFFEWFSRGASRSS